MIDAHHPLLASDAPYRLADASNVLTPALAIYPEIVDANIAATLRLVNGDANRWRPHVKTVKLAYIQRRMVAAGVTACKCATTLELATACEAGFTDVLLAFAVVGPHVERVKQIAAQYPQARIAALVESEPQIRQWAGTPIGIFLDVNTGMNRTGVEQARPMRSSISPASPPTLALNSAACTTTTATLPGTTSPSVRRWRTRATIAC